MQNFLEQLNITKNVWLTASCFLHWPQKFVLIFHMDWRRSKPNILLHKYLELFNRFLLSFVAASKILMRLSASHLKVRCFKKERWLLKSFKVFLKLHCFYIKIIRKQCFGFNRPFWWLFTFRCDDRDFYLVKIHMFRHTFR